MIIVTPLKLLSGAIHTEGTGSPEGVVTAVVSSLYFRTDGAAGSIFYVKESGSGNTGWVAYKSPVSFSTNTDSETIARLNLAILR